MRVFQEDKVVIGILGKQGSFREGLETEIDIAEEQRELVFILIF